MFGILFLFLFIFNNLRPFENNDSFVIQLQRFLFNYNFLFLTLILRNFRCRFKLSIILSTVLTCLRQTRRFFSVLPAMVSPISIFLFYIFILQPNPDYSISTVFSAKHRVRMTRRRENPRGEVAQNCRALRTPLYRLQLLFVSAIAAAMVDRHDDIRKRCG